MDESIEAVPVDPRGNGGLIILASSPAPPADSSKAGLPRHPLIGFMRYRRSLCGRQWLLSPDITMWISPPIVTLLLAVGNVLVAGHAAPWWEIAAFAGVVGTAFGLSFLITCTDPGIIPSTAATGGFDAYRHETSWTECRICHIRRPPRSSHCYTCGVCVLEHDHHCGILGGCVGLRSLRYFVGYLIAIAIGSSMALVMLVRGWTAEAAAAAALLPPGSHAVEPQRLQHGRGFGRDAAVPASLPFYLILGIFTASILIAVGGLGAYYVCLVIGDTTRREAQGKGSRYVKSAAATANAIGGSAATHRHQHVTTTITNGIGMVSSSPPPSSGGNLLSPGVSDLASCSAMPSESVLGTGPYHENVNRGRKAAWCVRRFGNLARVLFPPPSLVLPSGDYAAIGAAFGAEDRRTTSGHASWGLPV